jgi:hypothetical protein
MPDFYNYAKHEPDEVILRKQLPGYCASPQCAGRVRTFQLTCYRDPRQYPPIYRCLSCNSTEHYQAADDPAFDPNIHKPFRDDEDDGPHTFRRYQKGHR